MADRVRLRLSARDVQRLQQCMAGQILAARALQRRRQRARRCAWLVLALLLTGLSVLVGNPFH